MGEVYRARDVRLDRIVALKVLRGDRMSDVRSRQSLIHEARALSALNNAHVAALFDVITHEGTDCLVMEYVPGSSLDKLVRAGGLPVGLVLRYAIQIADALVAAHARAIIHRDLKPSNVIVTPDGSVKLLDFGIAKHVHKTGNSRPDAPAIDTHEAPLTDGPFTQAGTPSYMSPEQALGKQLDERTDIFSFGVLLYEMLTGSRAFERENKLSTAAAVLHEDPAPVRELAPKTPPELEAVVARCLQKDPNRRFRRMADLKQLLEHFEHRRRIDAEAPAPPRWRVSVWLSAGAGVAAAALVAGLFWGVWRPAGPVELAGTARPLTSYPGLELSPSFSPDGGFVAFQWDGPEQKNWDIYVKDLGGGSPLRLTSSQSEDLSPAWSPDNAWIAFLRVEKERAMVMVVPPLGGPERVVDTIPIGRDYNWDAGGRQLAWTPDGKWIAAPSPDQNGNTRLFLLNVQSRERRELTPADSTSGGVRDRNPAFSWDGRTLAFTRGSSVQTGDLYVMRLSDDYRAAEAPRALTHGPGLNDSPAWRPDGREILFHSNRSGSQAIWSIAADGRTPPRRLSGVGDNGESPAVSRQDRLVYVNVRVQDINLWKLPLNTPRPAPVSFASSSRTDTAPQISPDGRQVVFQSDREGPLEIWVAGSDGSGAAAVTRFGSGHTGTPRWSPDGKTIAFDSSVTGRFQVYTIAREGGEPRQVTKARTLAAIPSWSGDGHWIYYTALETGREEIWKTSPDGTQTVRITSNGGNVPFESRDGSRLFFMRGGAIWWMPRGGGEEQRIIDKVWNRNFAVGQRGIYFERQVEPVGSAICFYSFATGAETELYRTLRPTHNGLAVSADESFLVFTDVNQEGTDLMLAEFRR